MIEKLNKLKDNPQAMEFLRYVIVGCTAAAIHYGIFFVLQLFLTGTFWYNIDYTAGYVISLICNYFLTTYFTFRSKSSVGKAVGFGFSHLINYGLHIVLFNLFIAIGIHRLIAPILVLMIAVPTNFVILRLVYHKKK